MKQGRTGIFTLLMLLLAFAGAHLPLSARSEPAPLCPAAPPLPFLDAPGPDTLSMPYLVWIQGFDSLGVRQRTGIGVVVKNGYVGCNYHLITGMHSVTVTRVGEKTARPCNGYIGIDESSDLIVISVPGLEAPAAPFYENAEPLPDGTQLILTEVQPGRKVRFPRGLIKGKKDLKGRSLDQIISVDAGEILSGPVFSGTSLYAFTVASFKDDRYYLYIVPALQLKSLVKQSFIIKDFNSLTDQKPMEYSKYQNALLDGMSSIIWVNINEALQMAQRKPRKIIVAICERWNGYCELMEQKTWRNPAIIRYVNENYIAVKLDAGSREAFHYRGVLHKYNPDHQINELAWSLLKGNIALPATVILDEKGSPLVTVPGMIQPRKLEAILNYLADGSHLQGIAFADYEREYWRTKSQ